VGTNSRKISGLRLATYAARVPLFSTDASGAGEVVMVAPKISVPAAEGPTLPVMFSNASKFELYDAEIVAYSTASITPTDFQAIRGRVLTADDFLLRHYGFRSVGNARRIPLTGTQVDDYYEDGAGNISAFKRYDSASAAFVWSLDGTNTDFAMAQTAFYPTTDDAQDLGTASRYSRYLYANRLKSTPVAVGSLPAAATVGSGTRMFVTDANATTFASIVAGGGANIVPVYSDGTNWRIG